jgi:hypothetical protein
MMPDPRTWSRAEAEAWLEDGLAPEDRAANNDVSRLVRKVLTETNAAAASQRALSFVDNAGKLCFSGEPVRLVERVA